MSERPFDPAPGFAAANGWDRDYEVYADFDLPTYVGPTTFANLPWVTDPAELRARKVDVAIVGAPFDDLVTHRLGRPFRPAGHPRGPVQQRRPELAPARHRAVLAPDRRRCGRRQHRARRCGNAATR